MNKLIFLGLIIPVIMLTAIPNVYATGLRGDPGDDATDKEADCFINGYDSGFAGKYDKDRAKECLEHSDEYNEMWAIGCEDSLRTEAECGKLINNPVEIEDYGTLVFENDRTCNDAGFEDGKAGTYNKERYQGCYEFGDYKKQFQNGCVIYTTENSCELLYEEKQYYCPDHPDVGGCTEFLQNATNKKPEPAYCASFNASVSCFSYQEDNPERYCLGYDSPRCKEVGAL